MKSELKEATPPDLLKLPAFTRTEIPQWLCCLMKLNMVWLLFQIPAVKLDIQIIGRVVMTKTFGNASHQVHK